MMKKVLLSCALLAGLGTASVAHAQAGLVNLVGLGVGLGARALLGHKKDKATVTAPVAPAPASQATVLPPTAAQALIAAAPTTLAPQRTPTDKLPKKAATQITDLEAQLERCHAAMLASPSGAVCSAEQRAAIQQAAVSVARTQPSWNLQPYQQEMAFYLAEDARRQQAVAPAAPAVAPTN